MVAVQISIITSLYNPLENEFLQCYQSLLAQTYPNWEWIIYDDGSTILTDFLQKYQQQDSRLILLKGEKRRGAAWGRKQCLENANGKWIAIQDGDDFSAPERLELQKKFLEQHEQYAWVSSAMQLFDKLGNYTVWRKPEVITQKSCLMDIPSLHAATLFSRNALQQVMDYRVVEMTQRGQDYDLFMRLMAKGFVGFNLQNILYFYRRDRDAIYQRSFKLCWNECLVRFYGFKQLKLFPIGFVFMFKPLVGWLIPKCILKWIRPIEKINQ